MASTWKESIDLQRNNLSNLLSVPLAKIAQECALVWGQRETLDTKLNEGFPHVPFCTFLYVVDTCGIQISDNIGSGGVLPEHFGRDRSQRPYMKEIVPAEGFLLSHAYLSMRAGRPSLTAVQVVRHNSETLGFLGADFDIRDLPMSARLYKESDKWRQIKGDPAIRSLVFQQNRVDSYLDRNMDQACAILSELMMDRGMFQAVIHYSSSRATIWLLDDPYRYRILDHEALSDTDICLTYPHQAYPVEALIPQNKIEAIINGMRGLRLVDETIYLRSASINIFNGMISLTFSCDGSHYMLYDEFLDKDMSFWVGSPP